MKFRCRRKVLLLTVFNINLHGVKLGLMFLSVKVSLDAITLGRREAGASQRALAYFRRAEPLAEPLAPCLQASI